MTQKVGVVTQPVSQAVQSAGICHGQHKVYKVVSKAALSSMGAMHISSEQDLRMLSSYLKGEMSACLQKLCSSGYSKELL